MNVNEMLACVNDYISHITDGRKPENLYEPIRYVLSLGGKRIRPTLAMLSYNLYKDNPETIVAAACAIETYHNYTLLHDDLMDNANMRRGHETVHKKWDANTAILSGDSMFAMAYELMHKGGGNRLDEIMGLFTKTALEIGEGQQYDMDFETRDDVAEEEYLEMIRLKTSVLLACALKTGAILAGASKDDADALYKFGEQIGLAFQLQDDYLDVYGDPKIFGKAIGGDILCNKKTYMLINALAKAGENDRKELERWINAKEYDPLDKISAVTAIYNKVGIDRMAEDKIRFYFDESRKYLAQVSVSEEKKQELIAYTNAMMKRKS